MNYLTKIKGRGRGLFLFLVMIVLLAPASVLGQNTLTIYDGGNSNNLVPYSYEYRQQWQKCEFVIPATALDSMGATAQVPKLISEMTFYYSAIGYNTELCDFKVFVEEVSFDSFDGQTSFHGYDNATIVYDGRLNYHQSKVKVSFNENYVYHGGNLLIGVYPTKVKYYYEGPYPFYGTTVANAAMEGYSDDPDNIPANIINFIPKTTFVYYDENYCFAPDDFDYDLYSITSTSVTLDWTPRGNEQEWKIKYSDEDGNETVKDGITAHPYTLTGLQPGTYYQDISVCAVCGEGNESDWTVNYYGFTTLFCDPENQCELHYELRSSDGDWGWGWSSIYVYYMPNEEDYISELTLGGNGTLQKGDLTVCDGGIYNFVWNVGDSEALQYISFVITDSYGNPIYDSSIDGVPTEDGPLLENYYEVQCPSCKKPRDFSIITTSSTSASFTWTADSGYNSWELQYSTDEVNWSATQTVTGNPTGTVNSLDPATEYFVRVRANCGGGDYSPWAVISFYTDCATLVVDATHPYSEDFDSYAPYDPYGGGGGEWKGLRMVVSDLLPLCWSSWNGSDDYEYSDYPYIYNDYWEMESNGLKFYVYNYEGEGAMMDQYAILPAMENIAGLMMSFKAMDGESSTSEFSIGVMTDPTDVTTFVEIQGFEVDDEWNDFEVYFGNYQGQGEYIAIKVGTPDAWKSYNLYIDNIEVSVLPTCFVPSDFAVGTVGETTATLSWVPYGEETSWQVRYSTDQNTWTTLDYEVQSWNENVSMQLTELLANNLYYVQVRANCGNEDYSAWSAAKSFRTACGEYQAIPYYEDFESCSYENPLPQCWASINTTPTTGYPSYTNEPIYLPDDPSNNASLYFWCETASLDLAQYAILPYMQDIQSLKMSFVAKGESDNYWHAYSSAFEVGVMTDPEDYTTFQTIMSQLDFHNATRYFTVYFDNYQGEGGYIAFKVPAETGSYKYLKVDNIAVTTAITDYKTFVTDGNWNNASCWENNEMPASLDDNVLIEAAAVIPSGCIAQANIIDFDGDGSLTIEDGGQLITNNAVQATVEKHINPASDWSTASNGWYFIASPISSDLDPDDVPGLLTEDETGGEGDIHTYDLYYLNGANNMWKNYRNQAFDMESGKGYLYANKNEQTLEFTGITKPYTAGYTVEGAGWNLVGNPYTFNAYVNQSHYVLNSTRTAIEAAASNSAAIAPCTGVLVSGNATFYNAPQTQSNNQGNIQIALAQAVTTRGNSHAETLDNAIVSFNEGEQLGKFYFGSQSANIYIPQGEEEYAIASSDKQGELPLNFKATENGTYTLSVNPEGVEMNYLHLIDNLTGDDIDLLSTPSYTFNAKTTDYESRFRLVFVCGNVDGDNETFAFFANGQLIINGEGTAQVIDMLGRILINETVKGSASKVIDQPAGIYMIRLINGENVKVQKVVVK